MSIITNRNVVKTAEIQAHLVVNPVNLNNIHVLIQSILCGETSNGDMQETTTEWRSRIEGYAAELEREVYEMGQRPKGMRSDVPNTRPKAKAFVTWRQSPNEMLRKTCIMSSEDASLLFSLLRAQYPSAQLHNIGSATVLEG